MNPNPGQPDHGEQRRRLLKLVARVERRVRVQRALERGVAAGLVYLMVIAVVVALHSTGWIAPQTLLMTALVLSVYPIAMILWGFFSRVDRVALAQRIDRASGLHDRLSTALSLLESGQDTAFVRAQIRDALAHQDRADTRAAAPFKTPADLLPFGVFAVAIILVALFKPPSHVHPLPEQPTLKYASILSQSTIEMERDRIERLRKSMEEVNDPEVLAMLKEMEELLDDVENQRISEKEFLERIQEIEEKYFGSDREEVADQIADRLKDAAEALEKEAGEELEKHPELKEAIDALKDKDLSKAAEALEKMAEKLNQGEMSAEDAEKMADLLEKFADKIDLEDPKLKEMIEKHRDLLEELQKKLDLKGDLSSDDQNQLKREKDKLDELEKQRDDQQKNQAARQVKNLQRATREMAEKLKEKDDGDGPGDKGDAGENEEGQKGENNEQGDQEQNDPGDKNAEQDKNADSDKGDQQGQQQDKQQSSQQEAGKMADDASRALKEGGRQQKSSQAREQAQRQLEEIKETMRRSTDRQDKVSEDGRGGQSAEDMRKFLQRARGEEPDEQGEAQQGESQAGKQQSAQNGPNNQPGGTAPQESNEAGQGAGDRELGAATDMDSKPQDSSLEGRDSGGPTKSEVIKAASEEGFATTDYKDVFVDYEAVVEEVMDREKVPAGYRYYVKRYFELIQPRD